MPQVNEFSWFNLSFSFMALFTILFLTNYFLIYKALNLLKNNIMIHSFILFL